MIVKALTILMLLHKFSCFSVSLFWIRCWYSCHDPEGSWCIM